LVAAGVKATSCVKVSLIISSMGYYLGNNKFI
jgi:hypothetical protein